MEPGARDTFDDQDDHILDLREGLTWLESKVQGLALLRRLGTNKKIAKAVKTEWTETDLATNSETITIDNSATSLNVADTGMYQINDLVQVESEVVRVTALASGTVLTVVRGYAGTSAAAHTAKVAYNLGPADPENSDAPASQTMDARRLYNYVQTFTRAVEVSSDELMQPSTGGNIMNKNVEARFIELNRLLNRAVVYGTRYEDSTGKIHVMGGFYTYITTNVLDASAADITNAILDARFKAIVDAGGDPTLIVCGTTQKQKLDAIDANLVRQGKRDRVGGSSIVKTWQTGVLEHDVDILVDNTIKPDEILIIDESRMEVGYAAGNGVDGAFRVEDASTKGKDGMKKVLRGKYTVKFDQEKSMAAIQNLGV